MENPDEALKGHHILVSLRMRHDMNPHVLRVECVNTAAGITADLPLQLSVAILH